MKKTSLILAAVIMFAFTGTNFAAETPIENSIEAYTQQIQQNPDAALAYSNRASLKFIKKDIQGAITDFDKAIQINPNNPELYLNRGYIKQVINDLNGAMADYNAALKVRPNFAYAYNNRGVLKAALNDIQGAMDDYAKALQINPKYSDVYYNRANLKYMLSDNNGALNDYNKAIEINPKDAEAFNNRGVVKKRLNFNVGALSDYSQAIALNPKDSIAYANRGRLKKLYFDNEGAAIDLDQAVALAEKQVFIKNVKPLVSNESYIASLPIVEGITNDITPIFKSKPTKEVQKANEIVAYNTPKTIGTTRTTTISVQKQTTPVIAQITQIAQIKTADTNYIAPKQIAPKQVVEPQPIAQKITPVQQPTVIKEQRIASATPVINAGIGTVKAAMASSVTTTVVKTNPTTNVKLAESYYIRGLQKCVLRDLQGAVADLNKAIENNSNYADAYYYRAAIRKELGDNEGFKNDYSKAIQINPSLQTFNDSNCLSLIN